MRVMLSRGLSSLQAMLEHSLQNVSRPSTRLFTSLSINALRSYFETFRSFKSLIIVLDAGVNL